MAATKGAFRAGRVVTPDVKWTGDEPDWHNWEKLSLQAFYQNRSRMFGFYGYYLVAEDLIPDLMTWMANNGYSKEHQNRLKDAPTGTIEFTSMKLARAINRGMPPQHPRAQEHWDTLGHTDVEGNPKLAPHDGNILRADVDRALLFALSRLKVVPKDDASEPKKIVPTIQERIIQKAEREVISKLDEIHDLWSHSNDEVTLIGVTSLVRDSGLPELGCQHVVKWLENVKQDYTEAYEKTCPQMVEGYSYLTRRGLKMRIQALEKMIDEVNKVTATKKAHKKTRAKKPKDATKQVKHLKYQADSEEFSLTSVSPARIPTSYQLVLFNTKYKTLSVVTAEGPSGLTVQGSGLKGFNTTESFTATLRKPAEILNGIMNSTPKKLPGVIEKIKTSRRAFNGRVNDKTILVRVIEQKAA